jgi:hypothetical protein
MTRQTDFKHGVGMSVHVPGGAYPYTKELQSRIISPLRGTLGHPYVYRWMVG